MSGATQAVRDFTPILSIHEGDDIYQPLLLEFIESLPKRLDDLTKAFSSNDLEEVRRLSHKLRGSSATFGFPQLAQLSSFIEEGLIQADKENIRFENLRDALEKLIILSVRITTADLQNRENDLFEHVRTVTLPTLQKPVELN